jgi:phosphorylcholine metabolism protein LicD
MNFSISKKKIYILILVVFTAMIIGIVAKIKPLIIVSAIILSLLIIWRCLEEVRQNYTQPALRDLLTKVVEKFNQHGVKYWVDYGSLLGIVREGDVIRHDTDTDICIFPDNPDIERTLIKIVKELGHPYYLEYNPWSIDTFRIVRRTGIGFLQPYTDIYGTKLENGYYVDVSGKIPVKLVGKTKKIPWNGIEVVVPENTHETLVWRYGKNYMTPVLFKSNENFTKAT